jgi:hypothetical protein
MRIVRGIQNTVVLSLHEKATTANPQWIIKFISDHTGEEKVIAVVDDSDYTERYSLFRITETSDEDFVHSKIELNPRGNGRMRFMRWPKAPQETLTQMIPFQW